MAKLMLCRTTDEMVETAERFRVLVDGLIPVEDCSVRFEHEGLDLSRFRFRNANLTGSRFVNCSGESAMFESCILDQVWFASERGVKCSMAGTRFEDCSLKDSTFGPKTLNLEGCSFLRCKFAEANFRYGMLNNAKFDDSHLFYTALRSAELKDASFRGATLDKVSFEKTKLDGIDFTDAVFINMDLWGPIDPSKCRGTKSF